MSFLMVQICRNKEFRYINQYRGGGISYKREGINIQIVCSGANKQFKRNPLSVSPHPRLVLLSLKPGFLKKKKKTYKTSALRVTRWSGVVFCCGCAIHRKNAAAQYRSRCLGLKIAVTLIGLLGAVQCLATLIMISIVKHTFCEPKIDKPPSIDRVPLSIVTEIACGDQPSSFTAEMCSFHHQNLGMTSQKNESRTDGK